jgi:hypothetical protein
MHHNRLLFVIIGTVVGGFLLLALLGGGLLLWMDLQQDEEKAPLPPTRPSVRSRRTPRSQPAESTAPPQSESARELIATRPVPQASAACG